jgi:hypothetical protein
MKTTLIIFTILIVLCLFMTSCAPGSNHFKQGKAGFFWGIWHGWIAPIALIVHLFNPAIRIYETNNTGGWYDFGFYIAVVGGFGSVAWNRKRKKHSA